MLRRFISPRLSLAMAIPAPLASSPSLPIGPGKRHEARCTFQEEACCNILSVSWLCPLYEKRPKQFGIGGAIPPKRDLTRFIKWPKVVHLQRKKRILKQRLKVPPAINQFTKALDKNLASNVFKLLLKYRPEDKAAMKERLLKAAQAETEGKKPDVKKPVTVKYGLTNITYLIEQVFNDNMLKIRVKRCIRTSVKLRK